MSSSSIRNLPLFPLEVVLFPGSLLPLHIFEERYKTLIDECLHAKMEFGINFVHAAKMSPIGCSAILKKVVKEHGDGRKDIIVQGKFRYRVKHLVESASPYFVAKVSFFHDRNEKVDDALRRATIELYNRFVTTAFKGTVAHVSETSPDIAISFFLVQKAGLELKERQELLSAQSENERLAMLHRHLTLTIPLIGLREKREQIVLNDGYLSPV
jgi:Lon protease-like protein